MATNIKKTLKQTISEAADKAVKNLSTNEDRLQKLKKINSEMERLLKPNFRFKDTGKGILAQGEAEKLLTRKFSGFTFILPQRWDEFCKWVQLRVFPDKAITFEIEYPEEAIKKNEDLDEMMGLSFTVEKQANRRGKFKDGHHSPQAPQSQATLTESKENLEEMLGLAANTMRITGRRGTLSNNDGAHAPQSPMSPLALKGEIKKSISELKNIVGKIKK